MYCEKCNLQLEDDSLFCPYCGNKAAEENKSNICLKCRNKIPEDSEFCPFCGTTISKIDSSETVSSEGVLTNKNAERKKKKVKTKAPQFVFTAEKPKRIHKPSKIMAVIIALSIVAVSLLSLNIVQFASRQKSIKENEEMLQLKDKAIDAKEGSIDYYRDLYEDEKDKYEDLDERSRGWLDDSLFLMTNIVLVYDDGTDYYHFRGCTHGNDEYYWAYNIEAAKSLGFKPCPYCRGS